ncbi:hypothetical protein [Burkholderia ubonensis]|nr:hypothetical protein [Burkholderia ubonensis]
MLRNDAALPVCSRVVTDARSVSWKTSTLDASRHAILINALELS